MWIEEQLAKQHLCPHTHNPCDGMRCMAWRWGYVFRAEAPASQQVTYSASQIGVPEGKYPDGTRFHARKGYCGLAGKPTSK